MIELEHSPMGGSSISRVLNCQGSFLLMRLLMLMGEYESPPISSYADLGTAAHELGAKCLQDGKEPWEFIGQKINAFTVAKDDLDPAAVSVYVAFCEAIRSVGRNDPTANSIVEMTYHLPQYHPLLKGSVDFAHWRLQVDPGVWLIDYKNGEGIGVNPVRLPQLMYYAFLLLLAVAPLREQPRDFPMHLGIVQPNFFGVFEAPDIWTTTLGDIWDWGTKILLPEMNRVYVDKREELTFDDFVPGEHCQFCPVMLDCPKARGAFESYAYGEEFIAMLTDQELSDLYALRDLARKYGNELEKVVFARKMSGKPIASAKLVEKQVHRVWAPGAEEEAKAKFGEAAYNPKKMKSPAQMEKVSTDAKNFALQYGFKPLSDRYTVAPLTDRRHEVVPPSNADIFKNFAEPVDITSLGW